jgi:hypothetical protein
VVKRIRFVMFLIFFKIIKSKNKYYFEQSGVHFEGKKFYQK